MKTKTPLLLVALFISLAGPCFSEDIKKEMASFSNRVVAAVIQKVPEFQAQNYAIIPMGIRADEDRVLLQKVTDELVQKLISSELKVVSKQGRMQALEEIEFSASGITADSEMLKVGKMLSIDVMLILTINWGANNIYASIDALDVETSRTLFNATMDFVGAKSSKDALRTLLPPAFKIWFDGYGSFNLNPIFIATNDLNGTWVNYDQFSPYFEYTLNNNSAGPGFFLNASYSFNETLGVFLGIGISAQAQMKFAHLLMVPYDRYETYSETMGVPISYLAFPINKLKIGAIGSLNLSDLLCVSLLLSMNCTLLQITGYNDPASFYGPSSIVFHELFFYPGMSAAVQPELRITDFFSIYLQGEYELYFITRHEFRLAPIDTFLHYLNVGSGIKFSF